jgi:hypothetical protein
VPGALALVVAVVLVVPALVLVAGAAVSRAFAALCSSGDPGDA